eukprot:scaffold12693_cov142-Isochrysis_galbana.AAC.9
MSVPGRKSVPPADAGRVGQKARLAWWYCVRDVPRLRTRVVPESRGPADEARAQRKARADTASMDEGTCPSLRFHLKMRSACTSSGATAFSSRPPSPGGSTRPWRVERTRGAVRVAKPPTAPASSCPAPLDIGTRPPRRRRSAVAGAHSAGHAQPQPLCGQPRPPPPPQSPPVPQRPGRRRK